MRDTAIRTALLARIQPLVDRLARDLAALAERRIEAEIGRVGEAFEVALSAYQSNGAPDLLEAALGPDLARMFNASSTTASAAEDKPRPTRKVRSKGRPRPVTAQAEATGNVAESQRSPKEHRSSRAVVDTSNARTCGCAARGRHRRDCKQGKSPAAKTSASDADDESTAAPRTTRNLQATYDMITRAQAGDQAAMTELVRQNVGLVHWVARRHAWSSVPYEDMVQEGLMGLVEALKRFDVSRGLKLTTYAQHWIRHFITRAHENDGLIRLPVASREQLRLIKRAEHKAGPGAPIEEVAQRSGLSVKSVQRLLERGTVTQPATLPDAVAPTDGDDDEERIELAREHIAALPERLRRVMELRYSGDGMTLQEVGDVLGVSRERVRQLESAAVRVIRAKFSAEEFQHPAGEA